MLDDFGVGSYILSLFIAYGIEILVSLGITLILKRFSEKKNGIKKGSGFVIPVTLAIFILLNILLRITHLFRIN